MEETNFKQQGLELIRGYFADYVKRYQATQPGMVKTLQYFIDWLKTAQEKDITAERKDFYVKTHRFNARVKGFRKSGDVSYDREYVVDYNAYSVSDKKLADYIGDFFYDAEADKDIISGKIIDIGKQAAEFEYKQQFRDIGFTYLDSKINSYESSSPERDEYVFYTLTYPFKDKMFTFNFVEYNGKCFVKDYPKRTGGCYVATCVYGSYDCPEVWTLRRYRDDVLAKSVLGRLFIRIYYAVSPKIVRKYGNNVLFRSYFKKKLDKKVVKLNDKGIHGNPYEDK